RPSRGCRTAPSSCRASTPISTTMHGMRSRNAARTAARTAATAGKCVIPIAGPPSAIPSSRCGRCSPAFASPPPRPSGRLRPPAAAGREGLLSEALRPARATDRWQDRLRAVVVDLTRGLAGLTVVEAANAEEESLAIAVALREAVEHKGMTAALVTPDRALARRVLAALGRWNVAVDDSGGDALPDTSAGAFARLAAELALDGVAPVPLLAALKHRLLRLGAPAGAHAAATDALERAILRGPRPRAGCAGLAHALATFRDELA